MNGTAPATAIGLTLSVVMFAHSAQAQDGSKQPSVHDAQLTPVRAAAGDVTKAAIATADPEVKLAPPTPIAAKKEELGKPGWDPEWDAIIEKALPGELLSSRKVEKDVRLFCPRYKDLSDVDKRAYWAYFFQALAAAEAGLEPTSNVRHTQPEVAVVDTVTRRMVRSEGLLQLTYMDATRYGCDFDWEKDKQLAEKDPNKTILQPKNNLLCGIKILDNQLMTRHKSLVTSKSYWSTLQPGTISYRVFLKQMTNVPDVCREPEPLDESRSRAMSRPMAPSQASRAFVSVTQ
jgi:hypothetical protein